jgi:hypothetical protein
LEDVDIDGRMILKWILKKKSGGLCTVRESVVGPCGNDNECVGCLHGVNSNVTERVSSSEGFYCMEVVLGPVISEYIFQS